MPYKPLFVPVEKLDQKPDESPIDPKILALEAEARKGTSIEIRNRAINDLRRMNKISDSLRRDLLHDWLDEPKLTAAYALLTDHDKGLKTLFQILDQSIRYLDEIYVRNILVAIRDRASFSRVGVDFDPLPFVDKWGPTLKHDLVVEVLQKFGKRES